MYYNFCTYGEIFIRVSETVKVKTYNGCSIIIETIKFCHTNVDKFIITQYDSKILLYDIHQVSVYKFIICLFVSTFFFYFFF